MANICICLGSLVRGEHERTCPAHPDFKITPEMHSRMREATTIPLSEYIAARVSLQFELRTSADVMRSYSAMPPADLLDRAADRIASLEAVIQSLMDSAYLSDENMQLARQAIEPLYTPSDPPHSIDLTDEQSADYKAAILKNMRP